MKHLILIAIKCYWSLKPILPKRTCLFHKSCSHFVYDETKQNGFFKGITAFRSRIKSCRPGYIFFEMPNQKQVMITVDNKIWESNEINPQINLPIVSGFTDQF